MSRKSFSRPPLAGVPVNNALSSLDGKSQPRSSSGFGDDASLVAGLPLPGEHRVWAPAHPTGGGHLPCHPCPCLALPALSPAHAPPLTLQRLT